MGVVSNAPGAQSTQLRGARQQRRCETENGQFVTVWWRSWYPPPHDALQALHSVQACTWHSML